MLNEDLYDDPRDLEIAKLRYSIKKFKEYDAKRKEYYAKVIGDLKTNEETLAELKVVKEKLKTARKYIQEVNILLNNAGYNTEVRKYIKELRERYKI